MPKLQALTREEIQERAPQVYTEKPYGKVSDKYVFLPTHRIVDDMKKLGWMVSDAKTMKTKNPIQKEFGKHMVVFYHPDIYIKDEAGGIEAYPQILIQNNHRGWGQFNFQIGIFRMICSNGLIIKEKDLGDFKLRHFGYSFEELKRLVDQAIEVLPKVVERINVFSQKVMTPDEQRSFAYKAIQARFGEERLVDDYEVNQVLASARPEDEGSTLWLTLNRVQESLVRGGFVTVGPGKKERKVRAIQNIQANVSLNEKLWEVAAQYC